MIRAGFDPLWMCGSQVECRGIPCIRIRRSTLKGALKLMRRRELVLVFLSGLAALSSGCSTARGPACAPGEERAVSETLYFGTAKPAGVVSAEEWSGFLGTAVTPRFPQGLSVWPAAGQWQSADGSLTRENSFVLSLVHPESPAAEAAVQAIVAEYKSRFQQEAVLRVRSYACTSF